LEQHESPLAAQHWQGEATGWASATAAAASIAVILDVSLCICRTA
jgi:hypothetical protein